jgi:hypothetical protein
MVLVKGGSNLTIENKSRKISTTSRTQTEAKLISAESHKFDQSSGGQQTFNINPFENHKVMGSSSSEDSDTDLRKKSFIMDE